MYVWNNISIYAKCLRNTVSYNKGGMLTKGIWEQDPKGEYFSPKWMSGEWKRDWRRLRHEDIYNLYRSSNIFRVIKFKSLRWAGQTARMEDRSALKIKPTGMRALERPNRKTILELILKRKISVWGTELIGFRIETTEEPVWMRHWNF